MRCLGKSLLAFVAGAALASREPVVRAATDDERAPDGEMLALEVAARFNETLLANVDAIDMGLTAILAGIVAVDVFTIDKVRELREPEQWIALSLLAGAMLVCIAGYFFGIPWRGFGNRDGLLPSSFIADFVRDPVDATADAAQQLAKAGEINLTVRLWKRILTAIALALLIMGVAVVTLARASGKVV